MLIPDYSGNEEAAAMVAHNSIPLLYAEECG